MGRIKRDALCDVVMLVLLNNATLDPLEIWEAPYLTVVKLSADPGKVPLGFQSSNARRATYGRSDEERRY